MEKTVKVKHLHDRTSDYEYWMSCSVEQRINALEMLRNQYIQYIGHAKSEFQRVCQITRLK